MSNQPLAAQDLRAAAETHRELGPEYGDAVVEAFLERIDQTIGARVEAHLAERNQGRRLLLGSRGPDDPARRATRRTLLTGAGIGAATVGLPLSLGLANLGAEHGQATGGFVLGSWVVGSLITAGVVRAVTALRHRRAR